MNAVKPKVNRIYKVFLLYWIVLVAWQNIRHTVSRSGVDLAIKAALIVWITFEYLRSKQKIRKNAILIYAFFLFFMLFAYIFNEASFEFSVLLSYIYPVLLVFLAYVIGGSLTMNVDELLYLCNGVVLVVSYMALYAIIFCRDQFSAALTIRSAYGNQLSAFFVSNHEYAMYLAGGIVCCLTALRIKERDKLRRRLPYWLALPVFTVNLVLTFSRTTMLGLACLYVIVILFSRRSGVKTLLILGGLLAAGIFVYSETARNFVLNIVLRQNTLSERGELYSLAIAHFREGTLTQRLFGYGVEASRAFTVSMTTHTSIHNGYLQILLYFGLTGFVFLALFLLAQLADTFRILRIDNFCAAMLLAVEIMGMAVMMTNTTYIFFPSTDSYFLTILSVIVPKYIRNAVKEGVFYPNLLPDGADAPLG